MPKSTPDEAARDWANALNNSTAKIQRGIERVTVAPTMQAAAKKDKMKQRLNAAIDSGKWEAGLRRVSLEQWKEAAINKGVQRIGAGATAAINKQTDFYQKLFPFQASLQDKIKQMPDLTLADAKARANAWIDGMATFKR